MNGKLIYLLEDDPDSQQVIQTLLSRAGYKVVGLTTVKAFKKQLSVALPDLCILDVNLPDGNGLDISLELSAAPFTSQVPILIMSANLIPREKYQAAGAWQFINKPFNVPHFIQMVGKLT